MSNIKIATSENFDEIIRSESPTLVDFWAEWCGPCHAIAPTLEAIADDYQGQVTVAKLNIDDHPDLAQDFGVMSIPTLVLFKEGVEKKRLVGAQPRRVIEGELAEFVA